MGKKYDIILTKIRKCYEYCAHKVLNDTSNRFIVNIVKTLNITIRSFLNRDIQTQACAMTFRTVLAIVPVLALIFAIGRGFGFQNLLQDELYSILPSQKGFITYALNAVDTYLNQASEGIFVGVGIVFLLYTLINLIGSVENAFNAIWDVKQGRTIWRKITDYTAVLLILPILMICGSGLSMMLSSTLQHLFDFSFITPLTSTLLEIGSFIFTCLFFAAAFMMIPNTKVKFVYALMAGVFTGIGFTILQWLFVTGQLYVAKYNAIYGSFSFLPLFLIWMQLVWTVCLIGALLCYSSQNLFQYNFSEQILKISNDYREKVLVAITATIVQHFLEKKPAVTAEMLIKTYGIPSRLVNEVLDKLEDEDVKIISKIVVDEKEMIFGYHPAIDTDEITLNYLREKLNQDGKKGFIPNFDTNFPGVIKVIDEENKILRNASNDIRLADIKIKD